MWVWIVALYEPRGEFDSSESRQYTTPVWFTWMLGVHPIPTAKPNASRNSNRRKQYWIQYKVLLPLLEKLKHFWTALSHFTFSWKHGSKWKFCLAWYRWFFSEQTDSLLRHPKIWQHVWQKPLPLSTEQILPIDHKSSSVTPFDTCAKNPDFHLQRDLV